MSARFAPQRSFSYETVFVRRAVGIIKNHLHAVDENAAERLMPGGLEVHMKRGHTSGRSRFCPEYPLAYVHDVALQLEKDGRLGLTRSFIQHGDVSVYEHVLSVAQTSIRMASALSRVGVKVDAHALVRGALLHDYFLYDWHDPDPSHRLHGFRHPYAALRRAEEDFDLSSLERNIIVRHMFPLVPIPPACREAWIVCLADKACALGETIDGRVGSRRQTKRKGKRA